MKRSQSKTEQFYDLIMLVLNDPTYRRVPASLLVSALTMAMVTLAEQRRWTFDQIMQAVDHTLASIERAARPEVAKERAQRSEQVHRVIDGILKRWGSLANFQARVLEAPALPIPWDASPMEEADKTRMN